jgi:hypothetical protein
VLIIQSLKVQIHPKLALREKSEINIFVILQATEAQRQCSELTIQNLRVQIYSKLAPRENCEKTFLAFYKQH